MQYDHNARVENPDETRKAKDWPNCKNQMMTTLSRRRTLSISITSTATRRITLATTKTINRAPPNDRASKSNNRFKKYVWKKISSKSNYPPGLQKDWKKWKWTRFEFNCHTIICPSASEWVWVLQYFIISTRAEASQSASRKRSGTGALHHHEEGKKCSPFNNTKKEYE